MSFEKDLSSLLNRHSKEGGSDTPDVLLARYLIRCLEAYEEVVTARVNWVAPVESEYAKAVRDLGLRCQGFGGPDDWVPADQVHPTELQIPWPSTVGVCTPGEPGYRWKEHRRPKSPCYECIGISSFKGDLHPSFWCQCGVSETCRGPCRRYAHDPSIHGAYEDGS